MILVSRTAAKESLSALFRCYRGFECKCGAAPAKTLSRIAYTRSFGGKWYPDTPLLWPRCRLCLLPSAIFHFLICFSISVISFSLLIFLWVDFYMRHTNLLDRLLREATGPLPIICLKHYPKGGKGDRFKTDIQRQTAIARIRDR